MIPPSPTYAPLCARLGFTPADLGSATPTFVARYLALLTEMIDTHRPIVAALTKQIACLLQHGDEASIAALHLREALCGYRLEIQILVEERRAALRLTAHTTRPTPTSAGYDA